MVKRSLISTTLFWALACGSVSAQEHDFRVNGTLISSSGNAAIVNGQVLQEGDRVDGAEVVSIEMGFVHMRVGSQQFSVRLGSGPAPQPSAVRQSNVAQVEMRANQPSVRQGETLSGIAERYLIDGVTLDQMMIALFEANPKSFGGNINVLLAGASLRIPDRNELLRLAPETATAEVTRQADAWRAGNQPQIRLAELPEHYGPVRSGETLSGIAERLVPDGTGIDQMMIALFEANPKSFDNNINVLYAGTVLRIPDGDELRRLQPEAAVAEVMRQTEAWRAGTWKQAQPTPALAQLQAWNEDALEP